MACPAETTNPKTLAAIPVTNLFLFILALHLPEPQMRETRQQLTGCRLGAPPRRQKLTRLAETLRGGGSERGRGAWLQLDHVTIWVGHVRVRVVFVVFAARDQCPTSALDLPDRPIVVIGVELESK